ncbi:MFS transporter [Glycomyces algeriensis]|uniref:MFS transporter n=1 Tax=Glycomyces algeriensis TaxID=256037 RepID=A0A9W6LHX5_9ACTN|nr:MFS transporter [Glycomyces algeriensis]MDA1364372.1 MFS transporter [Glycomyces algeriensis]MDR7350405.1 putative MFS family arabinose efflux permease [Glycomyces algeriensis]GLI43111.1 MFS transporter [Glycomyces algeriensis]
MSGTRAPEEAADGVWSTLRDLPPSVITLLVGIALSRTGTFIAVFLTLYLTARGHTPASAGLALTVFGVGSIVGSFASGTVTAWWGARQVIVGSMLLSGLAVLGVAFAEDYRLLVALAFAAGLFGQMYRPAAAAMMAALTPPQRLVMVSAAARLGLNVGAALGPMLGVWLLTHSFALMFVVNALTHLAFGLIALFLLPNAREGQESSDEAPAVSYRDVFKDSKYVLVIVAMFLTGFIESQYQAVLPLQILSEGHPAWLYGTIVTLNGAIVILFELPVTRYTQRLPMRTTIAFGSLFIGAGLALFGVPAGIWVCFAGVLVWTFGEIISAPSVVAYPALAAPTDRHRSRYIGAITTAQIGGYALGPAVGTYLFQIEHSFVWIMCAAVGLVAFLAMWRGVREPEQALA